MLFFGIVSLLFLNFLWTFLIFFIRKMFLILHEVHDILKGVFCNLTTKFTVALLPLVWEGCEYDILRLLVRKLRFVARELIGVADQLSSLSA
jgi:hypothetical protein